MNYIKIVYNTPVPGSYLYKVPQGMHAKKGTRVVAPFGKRELIGFVIEDNINPGETSYAIKEIKRVIDSTPLFDKNEIELAKWLSTMYYCSEGEALSMILPGGKRESKIPVFEEFNIPQQKKIQLSTEQKTAIEGILKTSTKLNYLYGITGSGKTEVFLRIAKKIIENKQGVIYLVPEISLTHQLIEEVRTRFGNDIAVLHSSITPSQKLVEWQRIRKGEAKFIIGVRSAIFAPVNNLGLIIIDEEHEPAYKSSGKPRYHARQVAMRRTSLSKAKLIMGSATPSIEAWYLIKKGVIKGFTLGKRLSGGAIPKISIIDMKQYHSCISKPLETAIRKNHQQGHQTILFLNRRGFTYFFHCKSCGYESRCRNCSVALTYHKDRNKLVCHYCGYTEKPKQTCPNCKSLDVGYSGFGTELIEEELNKLFPEMKIDRIDTDSTKKKGELKKKLNTFKKGEIDILLGTQMVAKGLNFKGVKLVGIVLADTSLNLPDFRAQERTFNLIVQVSGRAGRFSPDGQVIIQTYKPENPAIKMATKGDIKNFYKEELQVRKELEFPPYSRLFRIVFRGKNLEKTESASAKFSSRLSSFAKTEIMGPAECPISMIAGNYRFQLIIRTTNFKKIHSLLKGSLSQYTPPSGVYIEYDVDPISLV